MWLWLCVFDDDDFVCTCSPKFGVIPFIIQYNLLKNKHFQITFIQLVVIALSSSLLRKFNSQKYFVHYDGNTAQCEMYNVWMVCGGMVNQ